MCAQAALVQLNVCLNAIIELHDIYYRCSIERMDFVQ